MNWRCEFVWMVGFGSRGAAAGCSPRREPGVGSSTATIEPRRGDRICAAPSGLQGSVLPINLNPGLTPGATTCRRSVSEHPTQTGIARHNATRRIRTPSLLRTVLKQRRRLVGIALAVTHCQARGVVQKPSCVTFPPARKAGGSACKAAPGRGRTGWRPAFGSAARFRPNRAGVL